MITFKQRGNFNNTERLFKNSRNVNYRSILEKYGRKGVRALSEATPVDTGLTSDSWDYKIKISKGSFEISWHNQNEVSGIPLVILIHYGHGTQNGGYVQGRDFINPTLQPIFDRIANEVWTEVIK